MKFNGGLGGGFDIVLDNEIIEKTLMNSCYPLTALFDTLLLISYGYKGPNYRTKPGQRLLFVEREQARNRLSNWSIRLKITP